MPNSAVTGNLPQEHIPLPNRCYSTDKYKVENPVNLRRNQTGFSVGRCKQHPIGMETC